MVTARPVEEIPRRQEARGRKKAGEEGEGGDNAEAGDKQLGSCAAGKMQYTALCVQWQVEV